MSLDEMTKLENRSPNRFKCKILLYVVLFCSLVYVAHGLDDDDAVDSAHLEDCAMMLNKISDLENSERDASNDSPLEDEHTRQCIRYKDVNDALKMAVEEQNYEPDQIDPARNRNDLDTIARLIVETTSNLAKKFNLSSREINYGLPTIDTSKTDIWDVCPNMFKPTPCSMTRFRSYDGQCTNLNNSALGMSRTAYKRILPPEYSDGVSEYKVSPVDGSPLPNPREVSIHGHIDISHFTDSRSILLISWGQLVSHDLLFTDFPRTADGTQIPCCVDGPKPHPNCAPIQVSEKDPFYWRYNSTCMEALRTLAGLRPGCALGPRGPADFATARLDANFVYGSSHEEAINLRSMEKGFMKTWPKYQELGLKDLLPPMVDRPNNNCIGRPSNMYCFLTGDSRGSLQPQMLALHLIYVREHNRIATEFGRLNPHWDDERIYQETRHLIIAIIQHICYNELLPLLFGPVYMHAYNLTLQDEGYYRGYDKNLLLEIDQAVQTAAFRWGHTLVPNAFSLYNKDHEVIGSWETFTTLAQPFNMYQPGIFDKVIGGSVNGEMESFDRFMSHQLTHHLFQIPQQLFGLDLATLNINRGREVGLPGYNDYREWCGMPRVNTFAELDDYLENGTSRRFNEIYKHPDDIDLWSAGIAEYSVEGGTLSPTFTCILARQFDLNRRADRYWYENPDFPSSFTPGQLREIRKITLAKVTCENADDFPTIQKWTLLLPNPETNPRYKCEDLPEIDLQLWTENPETHEFISLE